MLATLNSLGISYLIMFTFFASLVTILICLGVFILARKLFGETAALFSVLFVVLLKSTVALLGPVFLVPMAVGLFFIPVAVYLVHIKSSAWVLILSSTLIIHPPTALALLLLINTQFITEKKFNAKNILLQGLSGLIALPFYLPFFFERGADSVNALSFTIISGALFIPSFLGYFITAIIAAGIYFSTSKKKYFIAASSLVLLFFIILFYKFKIEFFLPYRRTLMYLFIIFAISFGLGCAEIISLFRSKKIKIIITIILSVLILVFSLPQKLESNSPIYHIINEEDFRALSYIKENTPEESIVLADPWKSNAITPIAERQVYSRIVQGPSRESEAKNEQARIFFANNCQDTAFLEQNNISVIYGKCSSQNLQEVYPNVHRFQSAAAS